MSDNRSADVFRNDLERAKRKAPCKILTQVGKEVSGFKNGCNE